MKRVCLVLLFIICCIGILTGHGLRALACVLLLLAGLIVIFVFPMWLVTFIIMCVSNGIKYAWKELNPITVTKECFFDNK